MGEVGGGASSLCIYFCQIEFEIGPQKKKEEGIFSDGTIFLTKLWKTRVWFSQRWISLLCSLKMEGKNEKCVQRRNVQGCCFIF